MRLVEEPKPVPDYCVFNTGYKLFLFYFFLYEIVALREIMAYQFISYNHRLHIIVSWFDKNDYY